MLMLRFSAIDSYAGIIAAAVNVDMQAWKATSIRLMIFLSGISNGMSRFGEF
jgi:hypothetical protein